MIARSQKKIFFEGLIAGQKKTAGKKGILTSKKKY